MINIRRILYATDFSPFSNQAYFHALNLARGYNASLTIAYVRSPTGLFPYSGEVGASFPAVIDYQDDEREYWHEQLEQIRPLDERIRVQHVLLEGDPAEEIVRFATEGLMDMIVLGTHGRSGVERLVMGSVAESVLRSAPCSVLIAKMVKRPSFIEMPAAEAAEALGTV
jgi:nucleotide-binding universal stress UspA family protein